MGHLRSGWSRTGIFRLQSWLPLGFRSIFYPLLGKGIYSWPGHLVDLAAVIATVFGLATTVGLAALQITAGLDFVFKNHLSAGISNSIGSTVLIIAVIILVTTISTVLLLGNPVPLTRTLVRCWLSQLAPTSVVYCQQ